MNNKEVNMMNATIEYACKSYVQRLYGITSSCPQQSLLGEYANQGTRSVVALRVFCVPQTLYFRFTGKMKVQEEL